MQPRALIASLFQPHISLQIYPQTQTSTPHTQMLTQYSAVAIILKINNKPQEQLPTEKHLFHQSQFEIFQNSQILLLKRTKSKKMYSGQICLPGGKMDEGQSIIECAKRQTEEETGIVLREEETIGILRQKFLAFQMPDRRLFVFGVIFVIDYTPQIKLSVGQIESYRWVSFGQLFNKKSYEPLIIKNDSHSPFWRVQDFKAIRHFQYPSINVQMHQNLYGLTLYILSFFSSKFQPFLTTLQKHIQQLENQPQTTKHARADLLSLKMKVDLIINRMSHFKNLYFMKILAVVNQDLPQEQKKKIQQDFDEFMIIYFPKRAKF